MTKNVERKKDKIRISLLAITYLGVLGTIGTLILDANAASRQVSNFAFPQNVLLKDGQILDSQLLTDTVVQKPKQYDAAIAGRRYQYRYDDIPLDIEMRYIIGTLGNVEQFIKTNTTINVSSGKMFQTIRYQEGIGYYGLFIYQNQAYLSSCINPQGNSTVNTKQFFNNRHIYDIRFNRLLPWLLGEQSLLDRRCMWAHLSIPMNNLDKQTAYKVLEKAWFSCYSWWSPHFPKH
jgi:cyanosortase A-associated protein